MKPPMKQSPQPMTSTQNSESRRPPLTVPPGHVESNPGRSRTHTDGSILTRPTLRHAATVLACAGIGLALGAPFALGAHALLAGLRSVPPGLFLMLAASALVSAAAKAGKLHLLQTALDLRLRFLRTLAMTVVTDFAFLVSPLGAAGYGVNMALLERAGASWAIAAAIVGCDQALDLAFFTLAIPIALVLAPGPLALMFPKASLPWLGFAALGAACLAGILWFCRRQASKMLGAAGRRIPWLKSRWTRLRRFRLNVRAQFALLLAGPPQRFVALLLLTTLQWLLRYGALWFILLELGHRIPLGFVLAAQAVVLHLALWTGVPAGGGGGDLGLAASFAAWVPASVIATALVLWRFATLYCPLVLGALGFAGLAWRRHMQRGKLQ
jgi:glycosyltransferase 2 family protein